MMPPTLPPEMLDLIVDHLCDERTTLESCCLVSTSWVTRARRHLFSDVKFRIRSSIESWMKTFPDLSNSPAHYTRSLSIENIPKFSASPYDWICAFRYLERLHMGANWANFTPGAFVPLHGMSPSLRSLSIVCLSFPLSDIFDLVCSFPSLDDLELSSLFRDEPNAWTIPPTSPKLTGVFYFAASSADGMRSVIRYLMDLPDGLRFSTIHLTQFHEVELTMNLVRTCFNTLETLRFSSVGLDGSTSPPPLDLSKATKLKDLMVLWNITTVKWITMTLQTAKSENLERITMRLPPVNLSSVAETFYSEWQDLDNLLVELWTSRSIHPKVEYCRVEGQNREQHLAGVLPKLTSMGATEAVEYYTLFK